jgi:methyltransferase
MVTSQVLYLVLIGAVGLERMVELGISARNRARALAAGGRELQAPHFRVMALVHTLFLAACVLEVWLLGRGFDPRIGLPALGVVLLAQALRYWAIATLGPRWNVRIVVVPDVAPITAGPYRFIRHPNYLAVVAEIAALPMVHGAWLTALVFSLANALLLAGRIPAEEQALGTFYARAFAATPRFLPLTRRSRS